MKRASFVLGLMVVLPMLALADAGHAVLHPNGFGLHSYCAWKAQQGEVDSTGSKNQALYFQKDTLTANFAAGVAVIDGFEGMDVGEVLPLAFDYRTDGHCGAGAPRFNVRIQPIGTTDPMVRQTFFVGCAAMLPGPPLGADLNGHTWIRKSFVGPLIPGTITSLSIVFDEGTDQGQGFVYLDNIQVGSKIWTSAADNADE